MNNGLYPNSGVTRQRFVSQEWPLAYPLIAQALHGLGGTPGQVRWVLVCKTSELSFAVGDEITIAGQGDSANAGSHFDHGANANQVFLVGDANGFVQLHDKFTGAGPTNINVARWAVKCYARL